MKLIEIRVSTERRLNIHGYKKKKKKKKTEARVYMATNQIIHMYFSHMTYLMSHVTCLNNTCGWSYKFLQFFIIFIKWIKLSLNHDQSTILHT